MADKILRTLRHADQVSCATYLNDDDDEAEKSLKEKVVEFGKDTWNMKMKF